MPKIDPVHSPCYCVNLRYAANSLTKHYDAALAKVQLTGNQFFLLRSISELGTCNKSELAQYTRLERTTIIRNLEILRKKQVIEEVPGPTRRNNLIQLTEHGKTALEQGQMIWEQLQAEVYQTFGAENISVFWNLLDRFEHLFRADRAECNADWEKKQTT